MSGNVILIIAGILFVAIGILGAGITVAQIQVSPELVEKRSTRIAAFLVGVALITIGVRTLPADVGVGPGPGDPTTTPPTSQPPPPFPNAAERALLSHVPQLFSDTCRRARDLDDYPGATAGVECTPPDGARLVWYYRFSDPDSMQRSFDREAQVNLSIPQNADEPSCEEIAFEGVRSYQIDGTTAGWQLCFLDGNIPWIHWTFDALNIYVEAKGEDVGGLLTWWSSNESGPLP